MSMGHAQSNESRSASRIPPALRWPVRALWLLIATVFPNGRFVPRWTAVSGALGIPWMIASGFLAVPEWDEGISLVFVLLLFGVGVFSAIYRYVRVSEAVERQQTKWVVAAFAATFLYGILFLIAIPPVIDTLKQPATLSLWIREDR